MAESATNVRLRTAVPPIGWGPLANWVHGRIVSLPGESSWSLVQRKSGGVAAISKVRQTWWLIVSMMAGGGSGETQTPSWSQMTEVQWVSFCKCWRKASVSLRSSISHSRKLAPCGLVSRPYSHLSVTCFVKALLTLCRIVANDHTVCGMGAARCCWRYLMAVLTSIELMMTRGHFLIRDSCWSLIMRRSSCWRNQRRRAMTGSKSVVCENRLTIT